MLFNERMRRSVSQGPSGALALMRPASATAIPGLKRKGSEPLMSMSPRGELGLLKEKHSNLRRTSSSMSEDPKAKKKALLDAELKDAISALMTPNRVLVVKEFVDAAEKACDAINSGPTWKALFSILGGACEKIVFCSASRELGTSPS